MALNLTSVTNSETTSGLSLASLMNSAQAQKEGGGGGVEQKYINIETVVYDTGLFNCADCSCQRSFLIEITCQESPFGGSCNSGTLEHRIYGILDPSCHFT